MSVKRAQDRYTSTHWGINPAQTWEIDDPDLPDALVEMGKLKELVVHLGEVDEAADSIHLTFPAGCHLAFTAEAPAKSRLFCILTERKEAALRRDLWEEGARQKAPVMSLKQAASHSGGARARSSYPSVQVRILGRCTDVVYFTEKQGDGPSNYHHEFGEESGLPPLLCVDAQGRLWFAGGNFTVEDAGICD